METCIYFKEDIVQSIQNRYRMNTKGMHTNYVSTYDSYCSLNFTNVHTQYCHRHNTHLNSLIILIMMLKKAAKQCNNLLSKQSVKLRCG